MTAVGAIRSASLACVALAFVLSPVAAVRAAQAGEAFGIAMHGAPALPAGFEHMPYANPDAPKGGRLVWGLSGTFDSLNPLIVRGLALQQIRGFVVESLMARGNDEAFTLYGLLPKASRPTMREAMSPSISTRARASRTASRSPQTTCCFHGRCCATRAAPTTASIIPR
jgi:ABC-type oligopeptide transport system substrate-binding subunit